MKNPPTHDDEPGSLDEMLARMEAAGDEEQPVTMEEIVEAVGRRSFGPLLLLAGLVVFSPLSGIPGLPTVMALFVLLIAGQLVCRRRYFWLPRWLLSRRVSRKRFKQAVRFLRRPATKVDRLLRPRLDFAVRHIGFAVILTLSVALALAMPMLELVPFTSSVAGALIALLGLALIAHDGLLALLAMAGTGASGWVLLASMF
jgi:hypothetical protein